MCVKWMNELRANELVTKLFRFFYRQDTIAVGVGEALCDVWYLNSHQQESGEVEIEIHPSIRSYLLNGIPMRRA